MKLVVFGAGGRLGSRVVQAAVGAGHEVTAFVRSQQRLHGTVGPALSSTIRVIEGDVLEVDKVRGALAGQDAAIQTAGYIGASYEEAKETLQAVVQAFIKAACSTPDGPRRIWVLGGAGALDLPGRGMMILDTPGFPIRKYTVHKENYQLLLKEASSLDWSFACPGVMFDAPNGRPSDPSHVGTSIEEAPVVLPGWAALLPNAALLPALAVVQKQLSTASYEDVAAAIVANLGTGGPMSKKRVGFKTRVQV